MNCLTQAWLEFQLTSAPAAASATAMAGAPLAAKAGKANSTATLGLMPRKALAAKAYKNKATLVN